MTDKDRSLPWYQRWFDENYLLLYQHRNLKDAKKQVKLIINTLNPIKENVMLDLACGEGRYTYLFKALGYRIVGLDLSEVLLKYGQEKYLILDLIRGDMRAIPGSYDTILSLFTSFGYFDTIEENEEVISSSFAALKKGGVFWLDFLNNHNVLSHLHEKSRSRLSADIEVLEERTISGGRVIKEITFKKNGIQRRYQESVLLFAKSDLVRMMQKAGFRMMHSFGDYNGNPWNIESPRTILVARKEK